MIDPLASDPQLRDLVRKARDAAYCAADAAKKVTERIRFLSSGKGEAGVALASTTDLNVIGGMSEACFALTSSGAEIESMVDQIGTLHAFTFRDFGRDLAETIKRARDRVAARFCDCPIHRLARH